jgi:phosphoenolpyruvate-protein phosphotransferase (PTS system enzyme I)
MVELRLIGRTASAGLAAGPLTVMSSLVGKRAGGDSVAETQALRVAIVGALSQLSALAARSKSDGADILAFQIAMLEDDALAESAFAVIGAGASADEGWRKALDAEIRNYEAADNDHFKARASDLTDIRDRVLALLFGGTSTTDPVPGAIVIGEDMTPSRFLTTDWTRGGGIALTRGSAFGHVAMLARGRGIPMIVGLTTDLKGLDGRREAFIDGENAVLCVDPTPQTRQNFAGRIKAADRASQASAKFTTRQAATADGVKISVCLNIADPSEIKRLDPANCDGIGLVRTEFLFSGRGGLPDEETQYQTYRQLAEWAAGKPVTIRTLDAGADKPIAGLTLEHENNPFLGLRGIRLSLHRPDPFRTQLRALCRAAAHGRVEIMLPMVSIPGELDQARAYLDEAFSALQRGGIASRRPELGIMVEVPAAALCVESFDAAFFSIGSNDLTQYVMAAARDSEELATLNDPSHPAVLGLITQVAAYGARVGRKVSLCGDAGGEPKFIEALLKADLRSLSVSPAAIARTKEAISRVNLSQGAANE